MKVARGLHTITAKELIEALEDLDPNTPVVFSSNYGDYHRTQQVHGIQGKYDEDTPLEESGYSDSGWAIASEVAYDEDDGEDKPRVCVIR